MYPESRTIYFGTEIIHPPQKYEKPALQDFYMELARNAKYCGCDYATFSLVGPNSADLQTVEGESVSRCLVRHDRMHISEDWTKASVDDFVTRVKEIAAIASRVLNTRIYIMQTCVVRCLFRPSSTKDTRIFLSEKVCSLSGKDKIFMYFNNRPAHMFGIRLFFPAVTEQPFEFDVKIESFGRDTSWIFTENMGTYRGAPVSPDNLEPLETNIRTTLEFLTKNTFEFLQQFDA
jgi:hypothetical protein